MCLSMMSSAIDLGPVFSAVKGLKSLLTPKPSEDRLIKRIGQGDHKAFAELFEMYGPTVLGYCTRLVKDREKAEDISQEVWIKVVKSAPEYQSQGKFKSWLLTVARNTCFNELRRKLADSPMSEEFNLESESDERATIETLLIEQENVEQAKQLIDALPENQRICLVMWMSEELSYQELADKLQLKLPALKSLLYRAKQSLIESFSANQVESQ